MLSNVPADAKNKLYSYATNENIIPGKVELVVLSGSASNIVRQKVEQMGATYEDLGFGFGIITIDVNNIDKIAQIREIQYIELPKVLYTSYEVSNRASCIPEAWGKYGLTGEGVIVGFVDSGIDFTHPAFMNEQGQTRIEYIYDLTSGGNVWNKNQIDEALKSNDPHSKIPEIDLIGHGTHVAGIACAGGKIDRKYYGVAYKGSIMMVKMTAEGKVNYARSTQLMRGIRFLIDKSKELEKPLAINLSFSTNNGAHDGGSLLEQYINTVSGLERISFVIAAGNEGDRAHHVAGEIRDKQTIAFNVSEGERTLILQMYKSLIKNIQIEIKNPQGVSSGIFGISQGLKQGNIGSDGYFIYDSGPKPFGINGEIIISLVSNDKELVSGQWSLIIYSMDMDVRGEYNIWMPISEGLNPNTKFLRPDVYNTLGIPATCDRVVSVGSYDSVTNNLSSFSGRGKIGGNKPDLMAPGEGIEAPIPDGFYDALSGTSMAAPHVAGACALLMQWGIVMGNDLYMYGDRLKYFLLKGAKRNRADVTYPGPDWGYGTLCVLNSLDMAETYKSSRNESRGNWEDMKHVDGRQAPDDCGELYPKENYGNYIVEYNGDIVSALKKINYACAFVIDENYAMISVDQNREKELFSQVKEIVYVDRSALFSLSDISPFDASNITQFHTNKLLNLTGQGVVVGIIDTGIDYLNTEFTYEDDTTKVVSIWDQTVNSGNVPMGFNFGTEYSRTDINKAIQAKKSGGDPYSIVGTKDESGHGTKMASAIGARGKNPQVASAAPDCEFAVVKLKQAKESTLSKMALSDSTKLVYENTDIVLGIKYLASVFKKTQRPMVIFIPLESTFGDHAGNTIMERYLDDISKTRALVVVTGTGNEGDEELHVSGVIPKSGDNSVIEMKVDDTQKNLIFEIWCQKPDKVSLSIVSPSGEIIEKIPAKLNETEDIKFVFESSQVSVKYFLPEELSGDELIRVRITNIAGGIWKFVLVGDYIVTGIYNAWLPQRQLLKGGTRFLNPNPNTTLTIPSTGYRPVVSTFYNQNNNTIMSQAGRGYTRDGRIKPDFATGGVNVAVTQPGGGMTTISGSSVAAAVAAGATALMLQWGIVDGNDETMYSTKIKTYFIRGTAKRPGDSYPNPEWGYGILDLNGVFVNIRGIMNEERSLLDENEGSTIFMRIPEEIKKLLNL